VRARSQIFRYSEAWLGVYGIAHHLYTYFMSNLQVEVVDTCGFDLFSIIPTYVIGAG